MPIYEYVCGACGKECEILQKISDPAETRCPHCGKDALTKEVSAAGFRLKGKGWYETDFKSSNRHNVVDSAPSGTATPAAPAKAKAKSEDKAPAKAAAA
ncbi:MAG TPA: zinc ribbon domain-containing protein [Nevskiaceae bacterium]|nr:zinc ribbon domain-containing protein [Nevskiaceae bacterium]